MNKDYWDSFPQSFINFQQLTGQSSYWFTSDGTRDRAKPPLPISVLTTTPAGPSSSRP